MAAYRTNYPAAPGLNSAMVIEPRRLAIPLLLGMAMVVLIAVPLTAPPDGQDRSATLQFIGRFHPLVVHLPIALLLLVPLLELAGSRKRLTHLRASAGFVLYLATAAAVTAVSLGWLLGWSGGYDGPLVLQHMWGGVLLAIASMLCCLLRGWNPRVYGAALCATVLLMAWTSDGGGKITHGEKYLTGLMPAPLRTLLRIPAAQKKADGAAAAQTGVAPISVSSSASSSSAALTSFFVLRVQPILKNKCVTCHNVNKHKANLRLDGFEQLLRGSKHGPVIKAGDPQHSELYRRITLAPDDKDFMPADGKPRLTADEVKVIELWLSAGASDTVAVAAVPGAPPTAPKLQRAAPLAPDYRPRLDTITALASSLGVRLIPRSQNPSDGLVVRTVSFPEHCTDQTLAALAPIADLIVDAELARTKVSDAGLGSLAAFQNLRALDLSHTSVTSEGVRSLVRLQKLETLNLTATAVDEAGLAELRRQPSLKRVYFFQEEKTEVEEKTKTH